ncbi:hypothetical protein ACFELO_01490 [Oceanicaulis sp. LC35]|uniref:hypothetical protein n=1 Tax=Oceanicaulis sp. LC35 TaxID=3349635 RepID=UPI003F856E61
MDAIIEYPPVSRKYFQVLLEHGLLQFPTDMHICLQIFSTAYAVPYAPADQARLSLFLKPEAEPEVEKLPIGFASQIGSP